MTTTATPRQTRPRTREGGSGKRLLPWIGAGFPVLLIVVAIGATAVGADDDDAVGEPAPAYELATTHAETATLDDALADGPALLYFSMGPGCDGCFVQIPEIADEVADRDLELVSIMPGQPQAVASEARRLGAADHPILLDTDVAVSDAYDMLGHYGHTNVPGHSFALVTADGEVTWVEHYAEMFVPAEEFLPTLDDALAALD